MAKRGFIAALFALFALFAFQVGARTWWPPGDKVDKVIHGQDIDPSTKAFDISQDRGAISAVELHLFGFSAALAASANVKTLDTLSRAVHIGGVACSACTSAGTAPG